MIFFKHFMIFTLCTLTTVSAKDVLIKRAITPYQPSNPSNGQPSNLAHPNEQTIVHQAIHIREPVDRPPELPTTHPIQYHEPAPRYESPNIWKKMRGDDSNLGKRKRIDENEASTSLTAKKKNKSFLTKVVDGYKYHYSYEKHLHDKMADGIIAVGGVAMYGGYHATKAIVKGCNAACRAARERVDRIRNRITGTTPPSQRQPPPQSSRRNNHRARLHSMRQANEFLQHQGYNHHAQEQHQHQQPAAINQIPQHSASSHEAAVTDDNSVNRHTATNHGTIRQRSYGSGISHSVSRSHSTDSRKRSGHS